MLEIIKNYLAQKNYEDAFRLLSQAQPQNEEWHVCMAAALEGLGKEEEARRTVQEGYALFLNSYELAYMMAEHACFAGEIETAHAYCLLAGSLCDDREDKTVIAAAAGQMRTADLNVMLLQKALEQIIRERLERKEYSRTYQFVSDIVYAEDKFLFEKIVDKWLRCYLILLEVTACEQNHGCFRLTADTYKDWRDFEPVMQQFKFAFRRIWFGFSQKDQEYLVQITRQYAVSADFVAVLGKYSVHEDYLADVLEKAQNLFLIKRETKYAEILQAYAAWFRGIHAENREATKGENGDNGLRIVELEMPRTENVSKEPVCPKPLLENEIAYVMCANEPSYVEEAAKYLRRQNLPEGMRASLYVVYNANSMASGYNYAMETARVRYKIYVHQDTFLFDEQYTARLVKELKTSTHAMLALAGTARMPKSGRWWDSAPADKCLCLYQDYVLHVMRTVCKTGAKALQCPDGVLIATREDVRWREDLFDHFHFYDVSQGMEFMRKDLSVGFFENEGMPGVLHEDSVSKNADSERVYERARMAFVREYLIS